MQDTTEHATGRLGDGHGACSENGLQVSEKCPYTILVFQLNLYIDYILIKFLLIL